MYSPQDLPNWAVALIASGACIGVSVLLAIIGRVLRYFDILSSGGAHPTTNSSACHHGVMCMHMGCCVGQWCVSYPCMD